MLLEHFLNDKLYSICITMFSFSRKSPMSLFKKVTKQDSGRRKRYEKISRYCLFNPLFKKQTYFKYPTLLHQPYFVIPVMYAFYIYICNCRKHQRGVTCMQQHLFDHFCDCNHKGFLSDVSITFIDKTDPSDPLKREDYWRSILKTMAPFGLNIEDSVQFWVLCGPLLVCTFSILIYTWCGNVWRLEVVYFLLGIP